MQSENLRNLEIALHILRIPRLHSNLKIAQPISRLHNTHIRSAFFQAKFCWAFCLHAVQKSEIVLACDCSVLARKCRTLWGRVWASWYRNIMSLMSAEWMSDVRSSKFEFLMFSASWHDGPLTIYFHADGSTEHDRLLTMQALSIKPSLPYLSLIWPPSFLFSLVPTLQSSSSPFLSLHRQSVSRTQYIYQRWVTWWGVLRRTKVLARVQICKFEMHVYLRFR